MLRHAPEAQETVGTGRFETFLRRLLSVKGRVAPTVEPKLQAGFTLSDPPDALGELALLAGWRGFAAWYDITAVAAQTGCLELENPVGSGVILLIPHFYLYPVGAAASIQAGVTQNYNGALTQRNVVARLDSRGPYPGEPSYTQTGVFRAATLPATVLTVRSYAAYNTTSAVERFPGPWIVAPGAAFVVEATAVNVNIRPGLVWYERAAEPSELAAT